jgi:hypothetical protein
VSAAAAGLADGSKTQFDVDQLQNDGAIGAATHAWLKELAEKAAKQRAEKAEGVRRVDAVLHEGGRLDPRKPKDQAAVDAHFDAVVALGNPDQATLVAYVERIGMVPEGLVKRLKGGLASDDPQQVVNAASLIGALGKADARLVEGLGAERVRYAKAVTAGVEGALSPERAVELTDKSHGRPGVSDDEGAHGADVEDGEADKSKTAKDAEAEDDSNAKRVSGDDTKVGNGSGAKDDSATAGSDAAGSTSETVGPEIAPVGGTADSTDKVAEPDMVDRFWRRLVEAAEPETHGRVGLTDDDRRFLISLGLFRSGNEGQFNPLVPIRAIFETLINGGAQAADLVGRLSRALSNMTGAAVGQIAREVGASKTQARRVEREFNAVAQVLGLFSTYLVNIPRIPRAVEPGAATHAPGRVAAEGEGTETRTPRGATDTGATETGMGATGARQTESIHRSSTVGALRDLVEAAVGSLSRDPAKREVRLGRIDQAQADDLAAKYMAKTGRTIDVSGYEHTVDNFAIRHVTNRHSDPVAEAKQGQLAIVPADFEKIPEIIAAPDATEYVGKTKQGRDVFLFRKRIGDQLFYVAEVRTGRRTLSMTSLRKRTVKDEERAGGGRPERSDGGMTAPSRTSKTLSGLGIEASAITLALQDTEAFLKEGGSTGDNTSNPTDDKGSTR